MAGWKFSFVGLALSLIILGLCCDASDEGQAGEESKANQGFYYFAPPQPHFLPPQFQPRPQARPRPQPQRIPYYPYYPPPPRPSPRRPHAPLRRSPSFDISSFITYYYLIRALSATTAAPTTTAAPKVIQVCTGSWGEWGACSSKCYGTQSRTHPCTGIVQHQACNQPGFIVSGWYRAINCYDYFVSTNIISQTAAKAACEAQGAKLIHVALRNATVTADVMENLVKFSTNPDDFHIGLEFTGGDWTWEDTLTTEPAIWATAATPSGTSPCAYMELGNPRSGAQGNCATNRHYVCERKVT